MSYVTPTEVADFAEDLTLDSEGQTIMQRIIDAVEAGVTAFYDLPATPGSDIKQAIIVQSFEYWNDRKNPSGLIGFGDFAIRVNQFHPHVRKMLRPYAAYRLG
jgi:hypothetical protein